MDWCHVTLDCSPASPICQFGVLCVPPARTVFTFHLSGCPRSASESSPLPDLASGIIYRSTSHLLELYIYSITGWRRTCFSDHIPNIYQFTSKFYCYFLLYWSLQWFSPLSQNYLDWLIDDKYKPTMLSAVHVAETHVPFEGYYHHIMWPEPRLQSL